jgi:methyl-accepting chemotaxis protein WspA
VHPGQKAGTLEAKWLIAIVGITVCGNYGLWELRRLLKMTSRLNNLKLRDRTLIGYSIPTALIFIFSGMVYMTASKISDTFRQINDTQTVLLNSDGMLVKTINADRRIRRYLMVPDPKALELFEQDIKDFSGLYDQAVAATNHPEDKKQLSEMEALRDQFKGLALKTVGEAQTKPDAIKSIQGTYITQSLAITNQFEEINHDFHGKLKARLANSVDASKGAITLLSISAIAGSIISAGVALLSAYMIAQSLGDRVSQVVTIADQISQGNLNHTISNSGSQDEIGQLLGSFQGMVQQLNTLLSQVQRSTIQVTTSCTQLAASGRQLEGTITEQLVSTNEVSTTAKQIAATSEELVNTMEEVSLLSQATTTTANTQQQELQRMESNMQQLAVATDSIASKLGTISEKANNINQIVGTITKVADQTNLLSLNAAIEAEKAGEAGLGFAVVAKEIRRLADQTAIATVDIEQMIKEMQSSVSTGVMEMDKFAREVRQGVEEVGHITVQLGSVIAQVQDLTPRFESVNQGMEMQFQGAQQISEAMMQLSTTSSQTADSLQEINQVIDQLNHAEQSLRQEVMRFKIKDVKTPVMA